MNLNPTDAGLAEALTALAEATAETTAMQRATGDPIFEVTAGWVVPHYLVALRGLLAGQTACPERFKLLRKATGDVVAFQRGGAWGARLQLDREKLEFQRQKHRQKMAAERAARKGPKRRDPNQPMTDAELKACVDKVDEIMGLKRT